MVRMLSSGRWQEQHLTEVAAEPLMGQQHPEVIGGVMAVWLATVCSTRTVALRSDSGVAVTTAGSSLWCPVSSGARQRGVGLIVILSHI